MTDDATGSRAASLRALAVGLGRSGSQTAAMELRAIADEMDAEHATPDRAADREPDFLVNMSIMVWADSLDECTDRLASLVDEWPPDVQVTTWTTVTEEAFNAE